MEYFKNIYKHTKSKFKGRIDDEYYAKEGTKVLSLYVPRNNIEKSEVHLSFYNNQWKFELPIEKDVFDKILMKMCFIKGISKEMMEFYL